MTHKRHWRLKLSQRKSIVRSLAKAWYRPPCCIGATPARGRRLQVVDPSFYPGIPPVGISQRQWLFAPYRQSQRVAARPEPVAGGRGHYLRLREPKPPHPRLHLPRQRQPWTPCVENSPSLARRVADRDKCAATGFVHLFGAFGCYRCCRQFLEHPIDRSGHFIKIGNAERGHDRHKLVVRDMNRPVGILEHEKLRR